MKICFQCMKLGGMTRPDHMPDVATCGICTGVGNVVERDLDPFTERRVRKAVGEWQKDLLRRYMEMGPMPQSGEEP